MDTLRHIPAVYILAGARPFSLGDAIANQLAVRAPESSILAVDIETPTAHHANVKTATLDLNPLTHAGGFFGWQTELSATLRGIMQVSLPKIPIRTLFLNLAKYGVSKLEDTSPQDRADMLGVNFLAKCELIHTAMRINADMGVDNSKTLDIIDCGSFHSLRGSPRRALYNTTKTASLTLCNLLSSGDEVRRAFHISPGYLDTPMLHANHWTLKERGDPRFPDRVRQELPNLYSAIFRSTSFESFQAAIQQLGLTDPDLPIVFDRYRRRRKQVRSSPEGIIVPEELASYLAELALGDFSLEPGTIEVTAPNGKMSVMHRAF